MTRQLAHSLLIAVVFLLGTTIKAQQADTPIGNATKYKLGDITVTGSQTYNENTVIAFTGLRKGDEIYVPGQRLSDVVKKLWDLKLFSDIRFYKTSVIPDPDGGELEIINLELNIVEVPNLSNVEITGIKERKAKDLRDELKLTSGRKATENLVTNTRNFIENKYKDDGYLYADALVRVREVIDTTDQSTNRVDMKIDINKGEKVKVEEITFTGNQLIEDKKLRKAMKNTKRRNPFRLLKRSKYIEADYQEDLSSVLDMYKERGFRDARIIGDTLIKNSDKRISLDIEVEEGKKYYFGNIEFVGNTVYTDDQLRRILQVDKGDVYNGVAFYERISNPQDPDSDDISNQYQNTGYLFSSVNAVETRV
ncbi:MAG: POTRA domain-containing protein, partial [Nonlabens ulvanivorans]